MNIVFHGIEDTVGGYIREAAGEGVSIGAGGPYVAIVCDDYPTVEQAARSAGVDFIVVLTDSTDPLRRWLLRSKGAGMLQSIPKSVDDAVAMLARVCAYVNEK